MNFDKNYFQCYYNNRGHCKYGENCHYHHYNKICQNSFCRDKECKNRHPKPCKYGDTCKFLNQDKCSFKHDHTKSKNKIEKENLGQKLKAFEEVINKIKAEMIDLQKIFEKQEQLIETNTLNQKGQSILLEASKEEIKHLKDSNARQESETIDLKAKHKDITARNDALQHQITQNNKHFQKSTDKLESKINILENSKLIQKENAIDRQNIKCNECEFKCQKEINLKQHISVKHQPVYSSEYLTELVNKYKINK